MANLLCTVSCVHCELAVKLSMKFLPSPLTTCVAYLILFTLDMLNSHSMILSVSLHTQPASYYKPKTVSHKYTNHYFSKLVCISLVPKFPPSFLSVLQVMESEVRKASRLWSTCVCTPLPSPTKWLHKCRQVLIPLSDHPPRNRLGEASLLPLSPGGVLGNGFC